MRASILLVASVASGAARQVVVGGGATAWSPALHHAAARARTLVCTLDGADGQAEDPPAPKKKKPSPEVRERMLSALFTDSEKFRPDGRPTPSTEVPSHMSLELDEDGEPELARFTYVDEDTCIGCKNCAFVARNTFFMEDSFSGKARVFHQGGDSEDLIDEAIDSCPVNCIHYVSHEDLVTLENERLRREDSLDFNNYASFKRAWTGQDVAVPETNAKYYGSLAQGVRCNNCPSRGCAKCPMFGVGQNPIYLRRKEEREARKRRSGEAAQEEADRQAQRQMDILFADVEAAAPAPTVESAEESDVFGAIFGDYVVPDEEAPPVVAEDAATTEAKQRLRDVLQNEAADGLDPYAVLGVARDVDVAEVRRAFRKLAMQWHPDRCATLPEVEQLQAELIFKQINMANEVLSDEAKRRAYDEGEATIAQLVDGFWEGLVQKMRGDDAAGQDAGKVVPVALGSGVALAELTEEEELDMAALSAADELEPTEEA